MFLNSNLVPADSQEFGTSIARLAAQQLKLLGIAKQDKVSTYTAQACQGNNNSSNDAAEALRELTSRKLRMRL